MKHEIFAGEKPLPEINPEVSLESLARPQADRRGSSPAQRYVLNFIYLCIIFLWVEEKSTFEEISRFSWEFFLSLKAFLNEMQETVVVGVITLHLKEHFN